MNEENEEDFGEIDSPPERDPDQMRDEIIDEAMFCETMKEAEAFAIRYPWAQRYLPDEFRYNHKPSVKPKAGVTNEGHI